jgi:hypothetical protein
MEKIETGLYLGELLVVVGLIILTRPGGAQLRP